MNEELIARIEIPDDFDLHKLSEVIETLRSEGYRLEWKRRGIIRRRYVYEVYDNDV